MSLVISRQKISVKDTGGSLSLVSPMPPLRVCPGSSVPSVAGWPPCWPWALDTEVSGGGGLTVMESWLCRCSWEPLLGWQGRCSGGPPHAMAQGARGHCPPITCTQSLQREAGSGLAALSTRGPLMCINRHHQQSDDRMFVRPSQGRRTGAGVQTPCEQVSTDPAPMKSANEGGAQWPLPSTRQLRGENRTPGPGKTRWLKGTSEQDGTRSQPQRAAGTCPLSLHVKLWP